MKKKKSIKYWCKKSKLRMIYFGDMLACALVDNLLYYNIIQWRTQDFALGGGGGGGKFELKS